MVAAAEVVGRAGLKLEAALERFALDGEVRGARAVDVGASTGGFTEALLRHGAAHVVAVDAGHGQLHARLRGDARVESLEGADWKTLALGIAPGPFDFFTVDVSFVAARSMLRGLAFRLRAGAHGVVLVKPQFELPERLLRGEKKADGKVDDPGLRRAALARLTEKAERLGFRILAHADSPVAGGSGTVELLAHLRFEGRPASMPQPGERRPVIAKAKAKASRRGAASGLPAVHRWFAVAGPGLEEVTAREVAALPGVANVQAVAGGVDFAGPPEVGYRANLELRIATRVLLRLGEVRAREFGKLRHAVAALPWEAFVPAGRDVKIDVSAATSRCRLYHTGAIAEAIEAAVADRMGGLTRAPRKGSGPDAPDDPDRPSPQPTGTSGPSVLVRGVEDRFTISVDASGELLHRRGWRQENAAAPMRETLAAGLLALCDWDPSTPLCDPMCGAGTIPIEACAQALGIAPGLQRRFAFEDWPLYAEASQRAAWERLRDEARARAEQRAGAAATAPIIAGADRSAPSIEAARRNASRAGFAGGIRFERQELADMRPPPGAPPGLVLINPPYGRRLGNPRALGLLYREIGFVLRSHFRGWRAGVLVASRPLGDAIRLPVASSHPLSNGGLRVTLLRFEIA